jgi:hypothetical protein
VIAAANIAEPERYCGQALGDLATCGDSRSVIDVAQAGYGLLYEKGTPMTNAHEPISPDPLDDPSRPSSSPSEDFDEDALGADPFEAAMDPPEHWSSVTQTGYDDLSEGEESLDERLAEEEPEVFPDVDAEQNDPGEDRLIDL